MTAERKQKEERVHKDRQLKLLEELSDSAYPHKYLPDESGLAVLTIETACKLMGFPQTKNMGDYFSRARGLLGGLSDKFIPVATETNGESVKIPRGVDTYIYDPENLPLLGDIRYPSLNYPRHGSSPRHVPKLWRTIPRPNRTAVLEQTPNGKYVRKYWPKNN